MWNPTISQEVSRNLPVGPCSNHPRDICFEADYQRIVKQKIEIQLYIISGEGSFGVWKTEEAENNFFSTSQGKRNIVLISTHKMSLSVIIFEIRISALFVSSTVNCDAIAHIFLNDLTIFLKCANIQLFIPAQKNVTFYVINQTNNFSLLLGPLNIFRLLFHFLSFLHYLPNCKQLTFNFNCQYWCPTPMVLHHPCGGGQVA